jgi:hypothetical protein
MFPFQFEGCLVCFLFVNLKFYLSVYTCDIESCLWELYTEIFLKDAKVERVVKFYSKTNNNSVPITQKTN